MSKVFDWSTIARGEGFDDRRRRLQGNDTYRQRVQKSLTNFQAQQETMEFRKSQEPLLKSQLLDTMVNRKPLIVMKAISNPTEALGGIIEDEEDDGFYYSGPKGDSANRTANASFQEVMETIPAGTQLVFKSIDAQMGQWIFSSQTGKEYAIYDKPTIMFQQQVIENPGFFGLLYNTNLINEIGE